MNNNPNGLIAPQAIENDGDVTAEAGLAPVSQLGFDAARYWSYLEGIEASDAQKAALLETLWSIMSRFVEIGFGVDPVQTVIPALIRAAIEEEQAEETAARVDFETVAGSRYKKKENDDDR